ncbi:MAG: hypothetical protein KJ792_01910 [Actinobacteria bacterium]|nr:hypothetical protein [Actinomycetota bacterium]MCG2801720.1 hypothetical protein [Cellulomonas sp.]
MVEGNVVKADRKTGSMTARDTGDKIDWDYIEARVLTPEYDIVEVRFPADGAIPVPGRDEIVRLRCEARAANGNLKMTVLSVEAAPAPLVASGKQSA